MTFKRPLEDWPELGSRPQRIQPGITHQRGVAKETFIDRTGEGRNGAAGLREIRQVAGLIKQFFGSVRNQRDGPLAVLNGGGAVAFDEEAYRRKHVSGERERGPGLSCLLSELKRFLLPAERSQSERTYIPANFSAGFQRPKIIAAHEVGVGHTRRNAGIQPAGMLMSRERGFQQAAEATSMDQTRE
jgi:hypothetical protein